MSFSSYFVLSTLVVAGVMAHAYVAHEQFYPAVVYLSTDKMCLAVMYNFAFALFLLFGKVLLKLFIGPLRDLEVEQLVDSGRGFLADTILFLVFYAPTIDNREVGTVYLIQYICCVIFMKVFHLTTQIRVSHMFEVGFPTLIVNVKLVALMCLLLTLDLVALQYFYHIASKSSTFFTWILFEALTMSTVVVVSICKYSVHMIDLRLDNGWPGKSVCIFYIDLVHDVASMTLYLVFMLTFFVQNPSRLPIYMMADVIQVARKLAQRLRSFRRYRRISANMEVRFPDATDKEIEDQEQCVICRDSLADSACKPKKLPCGHIFHIDCLRSWLVMQQVCPTCRAEIPTDGPNHHEFPAPVAAPQIPHIPPQAPEQEVLPPQGERPADPPNNIRAPSNSSAPPTPSVPPTPSPSSGSGSQPAVGVKAVPSVTSLPGGVPKVMTISASSSASNQGARIEFGDVLGASLPSLQEIQAELKRAEDLKQFFREQADFWMKAMQTIESDHPPVHAETAALLAAQHSRLIGSVPAPASSSASASASAAANDSSISNATSSVTTPPPGPTTGGGSSVEPVVTSQPESVTDAVPRGIARTMSAASGGSVEDQMSDFRRLQREKFERQRSAMSMASVDTSEAREE